MEMIVLVAMCDSDGDGGVVCVGRGGGQVTAETVMNGSGSVGGDGEGRVRVCGDSGR